MSEQDYLIQLATEITSFFDDSTFVIDRCCICPIGGLDSIPILQRLFDAISGNGVHANTARLWVRHHSGSSFLGVGREVSLGSCNLTLPMPNPKNKVQADIMEVFCRDVHDVNFNVLLARKIKITFGESFASRLLLPSNWFDELRLSFQLIKPFVKICWLKMAAGAWCTSFRFRHMSGTHVLPCICGCHQCDDTLDHYMQCAVLWGFVANHFGIEEDISLQSRLCLTAPSELKLRRLALAHFSYSQVSSNPECEHFLSAHVASPGLHNTWREIHGIALGISRAG